MATATTVLGCFLALSLGSIPPDSATEISTDGFGRIVRIELAEDLEESAVEDAELVILKEDDSLHRAHPLRATDLELRDLPTEPWRLTCRGAAVWCPVVGSASAPDGAPVELFVAGRTTLSATWSAVDGRPPEHGVLQGRLATNGDRMLAFSTAIAADERGRWTIEVPRGELDLRIATPDFAPVYRWEFDSRRTQTLGALTLHRGGSVSGFVWDSVVDRPLLEATVRLEHPGSTTEPALSDRKSRLGPRTTTGSQGFFQLSPISAGTFRLVVSAPDRATRRVDGVVVEAGAELHMQRPIVVTGDLTLDLILDPPVDPEGQPWRVELRPETLGPGDHRRLVATTDETGGAHFAPLDPQEHRVVVTSDSGDRFYDQALQIEEDALQVLSIPLLRVVGTVTLNGEALLADIAIETGERDRIDLTSEPEDGAFEGWIRRPEHDILFVTVRSELPKLSRRLVLRDPEIRDDQLDLDLDLHGLEIRGETIDPYGHPVAAADVSIVDGDGTVAATETDDDGRFVFEALPAGSFGLEARHPDAGESELVDLALGPSPPATSFRLVLWPRERVQGLVRTAAGHPVAGATVEIRAAGPVASFARVQTTSDGQFEARLAGEPSRAAVSVIDPSHVAWSTCQTLPDKGTWHLTLPESPPGSLELRIRADADKPPITGGNIVLLTSTGGAMSWSALLRWARDTGHPADPGTDHLVLPNMASGLGYRLLWMEASLAGLGALACAAPEGSGSEWTFLHAGARGVVELDLTPLQNRQ